MKEKPFENFLGKGENAGNQHFPPFPQCFLSVSFQSSIFHSHLFCHLQMLSIGTSLKFFRLLKGIGGIVSASFKCFQLDQSKKFSFGKGLEHIGRIVSTSLCAACYKVINRRSVG